MTRVHLALLAVLALAAALRLQGITSGLALEDPASAVLVNQLDEEGMAIAVRDHFLRGDLRPGAFAHWGTVGYFLFGSVDFAVLGMRSLLGHGDIASQVTRLETAPSLLHLVHRLVVVAAALLTIVVVFRLARRELSTRVALAAATILATSYLHARVSHQGTLDVLLGLWLALVMDATLLLRREWTRPRAVVAFALVAVAALTKFYGAISVLLPLAVALIETRVPRRRVLGDCAIAACVAATLGAALATPLFVGFEEFAVATKNQSATIGFRVDRVLDVIVFHARRTFGVGAGFAAAAFALVGLGAFLLRRAENGAGRVAAFSLAVPFVLLVATSNQVPRYGASVMPAFAVLAAVGVAALVPAHARGARTIFPLVIAMTVGPPFLRAGAYARLLSQRDTRLDVLDVLREENAKREDVLAFGLYGLPRWSVNQVRPADLPFVDFLTTVHWKRSADAATLLASRPRFVIHEEGAFVEGSPTDLDALGFDEWQRTAGGEYRERLRVDSRTEPRDRYFPEEGTGEPEHLIPFDEPWRMSRPGPVIVLYEKIASDGSTGGK